MSHRQDASSSSSSDTSQHPNASHHITIHKNDSLNINTAADIKDIHYHPSAAEEDHAAAPVGRHSGSHDNTATHDGSLVGLHSNNSNNSTSHHHHQRHHGTTSHPAPHYRHRPKPVPPKPFYTYTLVVICLSMAFYVYYTYLFAHVTPLLQFYDVNASLLHSMAVKLYGIVCLVVFSTVFLLGIISYIRVCFTDPGSVPDEWNLPQDRSIWKNRRLLRKHYHRTEMVELTRDGRIRVCRTCSHQKPDRTHHCSSCGKCVLRMDHHCPWVNNCVGYKNHKFFLLFIFWLIIGATFMNFTLLPRVISIFSWNKPPEHMLPNFTEANILWIFFMAFFFSFSLSFFLLFHLKMVLWNETTIESMEMWSKFEYLYNGNPYDTGSYRKNWESVFGTDWRYWIIPTNRALPGDGCHYVLEYDEYV